MSSFRIESWAAFAPGLETGEDWAQWLRHPVAIDAPADKIKLTAVPPLLRRRFGTPGKYAMAAAMPLVETIDDLPSIFASRHGDTLLSLELLQGIARGEPMSPTSFSLAVHNAVSGLFSIVRKDRSAVTAIAAMQGLVLQTLFEAIGQLQTVERLLCVIYDIPLPDFYQQCREEDAEPFPHAIALILGNHDGDACRLEPAGRVADIEASPADPFQQESLGLLRLLAGITTEAGFTQRHNRWQLSRVDC